MIQKNSNVGSDENDKDKALADEIGATPGRAKARETGEQVARKVAHGQKDEATHRTGRSR
jgi:hypothetical protein